MAIVRHNTKEIFVKIVYCGTPRGGKTTNLRHVHDRIGEQDRGEFISMATSEDSTLFFDFLYVDAVVINGYQTRFQLYTVPGQVAYSATRQLVLRGVDGIVFVADSSPGRMEENLFAYKGMLENLRKNGTDPAAIPTVIQYNKRDLPNATPIAHLNYAFSQLGAPLPALEASATEGTNVLRTIDTVSQQVLQRLYDSRLADRFGGSARGGVQSAPAA